MDQKNTARSSVIAVRRAHATRATVFVHYDVPKPVTPPHADFYRANEARVHKDPGATFGMNPFPRGQIEVVN